MTEGDRSLIFEWDADKAERNLAKHGISFADARDLWNDEALAMDVNASRAADRETRFKRIGRVGDRLFAATYTTRGRAIRLISARRTNTKEDRLWRSSV